MTDLPRDRAAALAFLDARIGRGMAPGLERIRGLLGYLADPHLAYPVIHVAGTNGKTTVARIVSDVLGAHGLRVGTYTSPHLQRVEERFVVGGEPLVGDDFVRAVADVAWQVEEFERRHEPVTYFELTTAVALQAFAAHAVDVAVLEVGLGGRLDATNVVDASVAVVTGIDLDHVEYLGGTLAEIASEKVAILDPGGVLVTGPLPAAAEGAVTARAAETGATWWRFGDRFSVRAAVPAVGGWHVDLRGLHARYDGLYLPLHGRHQTRNLAVATAAAEAFLDRALDAAALRRAVATATSPGRLEVVGRRPLVLLDGAHNPQGVVALAATLDEEFPDLPWQLVVGVRGRRDPALLLRPLRGRVARVWATAPEDPAAIAPGQVAGAAAEVLEAPVETVPGVVEAVHRAVAAAGEEGGVLVTGSLYTVGEARSDLVGEEVRVGGVHVRIDARPFDGSEER